MSPIIIIGSGLAGYMLAREFRKLNPDAPLQIITSDDGTYYSKPQLSSAFTHKKSAAALANTSADKMATQLNAEIITHSIVSHINADEQSIKIGDQTMPYSALVLAQGAEIIKAPLTGNACDQVLSVNNLEDYAKFREHIADKKNITILGAGLVGCEFTNDLLNGDYQINVIALSPTPLELLLPPELGQVLQQAFAERGVQWHLNCSLVAVNHLDGQLELSLSNGRKLQTEAVLSAIGLRPVLTLAKTAGLITQRGIMVDRYLRTNNPHIYALGDCAEVEGHVMFYVAPLVTCARALAQTLNGQLTAVSYPPMPVIIKTPACPVVVNPPPRGISGSWQISGADADKKALFYDSENKLQGFALTGHAVTEKLTLAKELPVLF